MSDIKRLEERLEKIENLVLKINSSEEDAKRKDKQTGMLLGAEYFEKKFTEIENNVKGYVNDKFAENESKFDRKLERIKDNFDKKFTENENNVKGYVNDKFAENESKFDRKLERINCRIKDIERDKRTDASIASAVRSMGIFEKTPQSVNGSFFTEELNDYYG
ncbi:hypothetical protein VU01_11502 [Candidatus Electrothrix marina]|uniref:Uncharacterized protein n=1 Tax=Candidatus Electrothrix marina TaxID=1859130 RepID=A0A444JEC4_9BACT|nr:hypothetical protein VU01_11502 [Candidatus Electrothrix marina]